MIIRNEMTIVVTLLGLSLVIGLIGILADNRPTTYAGILAAFATAPVAVCTYMRRTQRVRADELASAEIDGYRLALSHVARGLFDPQPGDRVDATDPAEALRQKIRDIARTIGTDDTAWGGYTDQSHRNNIVPFRALPRHERQAQ